MGCNDIHHRIRCMLVMRMIGIADATDLQYLSQQRRKSRRHWDRQTAHGVGMIVCVCNAINCKSVRRSVDDGARSIASVFKSCGKTPQCGRCFSTIRGMVGEGAPASHNTGSMVAIAAE